MHERRDHTLLNPALQQASIAWDIGGGRVAQGTFGVLAEAGNVERCAKICFVSWLLGPGVPIKMGHGDPDDEDLI